MRRPNPRDVPSAVRSYPCEYKVEHASYFRPCGATRGTSRSLVRVLHVPYFSARTGKQPLDANPRPFTYPSIIISEGWYDRHRVPPRFDLSISPSARTDPLFPDFAPLFLNDAPFYGLIWACLDGPLRAGGWGAINPLGRLPGLS